MDETYATSIPARQVARAVMDAARECGILENHLNTAEELANFEHFLFTSLFDALRNYGADPDDADSPDELTVDEINSLFNFVFARSAEAVTWLRKGDRVAPYEFDTEGLLTGTAPYHAAPEISLKIQCHVDFPTKCAEKFLNLAEILRNHTDDNTDPKLLLFEALKWCFRFGCHLALAPEKRTN